MENKSHAFAAGLFVIVVAAMLAGLAMWLSRDRNQYKMYELTSSDNVTGLQPQAAVRYKGVAVGKVTQIGFDPQASGNVLIRIAVSEEAPISPTTFAVLGYQGVTGLAHILLDDAAAPLPPLPPGPSGINRLTLRPSPFTRIAEQGPNILTQVEEATTRLNTLLSDDNQKNFSLALGNISQAAANLAEASRHIEPALNSIAPAAQDASKAMLALQSAGNQVSGMAQEIGQTAKRLNAEGGPLDQISNSTTALSSTMESFTSVTQPRIGQAMDSVAGAARKLGRTANSISDNPQSLIYGNGQRQPGPGEPGFHAPAAQP